MKYGKGYAGVVRAMMLNEKDIDLLILSRSYISFPAPAALFLSNLSNLQFGVSPHEAIAGIYQ
jgi:hypothetical protein